MKVTFDAVLAAFMQKKKYVAIVVEAINPKGCCADITELCLGFANATHAQKLKEKACRMLPVEGYGEFEVLVLSRGLEYEEEVAFALKSFLGIKDVTVQGIRPWKM